MLKEADVRVAIDDGLCAACAWCERYWEGQRSGANTCGMRDCGGPMVGLGYPRYRGPRPNKATFCFVCGKEPDMVVDFGLGSGGAVGCCKNHELVLRALLAKRSNKGIAVSERVVPLMNGGNSSSKQDEGETDGIL